MRDRWRWRMRKPVNETGRVGKWIERVWLKRHSQCQKRHTAALNGTHYSPERSRRASEGQRGKIQSGRAAKSMENFGPKYYSFLAPDGLVHQGQDILHFIRGHLARFDPDDLKWIRGSCRAGKALARLRPWMKRPLGSWKGWSWYSAPLSSHQSPDNPETHSTS